MGRLFLGQNSFGMVKRMHFCEVCGSKLQIKLVDRKPRPYCFLCQRPYFYRTEIGVCLVLVNPRREILYVQMNYPPVETLWAFPGGRMEVDEEPYETLRRELDQEIGFLVHKVTLLGVYSDASSLTIAYLAHMMDRPEIRDAAEIARMAFYPLQKPPSLAWPSMKKMLQDVQFRLKLEEKA